jgi:hypothetical protein
VSNSVGETDAQVWHRRFAMSCNNRAWDLSTEVRTPAQDREMLNAAHASAWHWEQVGSELNRMRATLLLAEVHALLGMGSSALMLAETMREYFTNRETPDWEIAFTHTIYAHAAHAAGRLAEYREAYRQATAAIGSVAKEDDRNIVAKTFSLVPNPL